MASIDEQILSELKDIRVYMGDVNAIRNGEYDPPRGANPDSTRVLATPDDIYNVLSTVAGLLERQNQLLDMIGQNSASSKESWEKQRRDY